MSIPRVSFEEEYRERCVTRIVLIRRIPRDGFHAEGIIGNYHEENHARHVEGLTLWYLQNATIMGRHTPGAGFFSSIAGGARSVTATIFV